MGTVDDCTSRNRDADLLLKVLDGEMDKGAVMEALRM